MQQPPPHIAEHELSRTKQLYPRPTAKIRSSRTGADASASRRSTASGPSTSARPSRAPSPSTRPRSPPSRPIRRAPTFANTIEALELSGDALTRVDNVFNALAGAHTNDAILEIEREIAPLSAKHWNKILMDEALFRRLDALHRERDRLALTAEQRRVLERHHLSFTRAGAALDPASKQRLAAINERLATLGTAFSQNVLADEQSYALVLDGEDDLAGLPDFFRAAARAAAEERGLAGKHVVTLSRSSVEPFLQFSARRDLREKAFRAWIARGDGGGETDNKRMIAEMVALRAERARLLGYQTFAHYRLADAMAKTPEAVRGLLDRVWTPARARALADRDAMQAIVREEGGNFEFAAWDWRYYAGKLRKLRCDLDEATVKPYFQLDRMIEAAFYTANRLFGLSFERARRHPGLARGRAGLGGARPRRAPSRSVLRRLLRAQLQAQRRLDDDLARPAEAQGRHPAARRQRDELLEGGRGRADLAVVRRRQDAVPRIRPRAARAPVRRHLSDDLGHQRAHRLGGAAFAALRALAAAPGDPAPLRRALRDRRADPRGPAAPAARCPHLQPGLRHRRIPGLGAGRSRRPSAAGRREFRHHPASSRRRWRASACRPRSSCATGRPISPTCSPATAMRRPITATCGPR